MKRLLLVLSLTASIAVPIAGVAQASSHKTIVGIAAHKTQLSTLVSLVKHAGLVKALSGNTKLTLFAPDNAAFAKVPKAMLKKLGKDKKLLVKVLEYHVVPGTLTAAKVEKTKSAKTLEGQRIKFSVRHGHVYVNGNARVVEANIHASNGIIHVINHVLIPKGA